MEMKYVAYGKDLPSNLNEMNSREKIIKKKLLWKPGFPAEDVLVGGTHSCVFAAWA